MFTSFVIKLLAADQHRLLREVGRGQRSGEIYTMRFANLYLTSLPCIIHTCEGLIQVHVCVCVCWRCMQVWGWGLTAGLFIYKLGFSPHCLTEAHEEGTLPLPIVFYKPSKDSYKWELVCLWYLCHTLFYKVFISSLIWLKNFNSIVT